MKKLVFLFIASLLVLSGCKIGEGSISTSRGLENESFLEFVGTAKNYKGGVDVNIDDKTAFKAKVHNQREGDYSPTKDRFKGEVYAIPTGTHIVTVSYKGNVIYKKQIFISAQENFKIVLQ